jgi:DNA-binding CsgD family transcriptional regulator
MLHVRPAGDIPAVALAVPDRWAFPACSTHPGSLVRPYRGLGPDGPGVYPQCVPGAGHQPHLLAWVKAADARRAVSQSALSPSEIDVLRDAAHGLTVSESAASRGKSSETVKSQRKQVLIKLGARNMTHAVALATVRRLVDLERAA